MSGLLHTLSSVSRTLEAQRYGLEVTGQNIANVNTPGYARRVVTFASVVPVDVVDGGGGVCVVGVQAARDGGLERRLLKDRPAEQREGAIADALSVVEAAIGRPGESIDAGLNAFFDAWSTLASDPTSTVSRLQVVTQAQALAAQFQALAARLQGTRDEADAQVRALGNEINGLTSRLADLNARLGGLPPGDAAAEALRDEQRMALSSLASIVDVSTISRSDGGVDVMLAGGLSLVLGQHQYAIDVVSSGPSGLADLRLGDRSVTADVSGGRLAGTLRVRDDLLPGYTGQLDAIAYAVATEVNAIHEGGFDLAGNPGGALFVPLAGAEGAAAAIDVESIVVADVSRVAAAAVPTTADNQTARAIAALRETRVMDGGQATIADVWARLAYRVGADTATARTQQEGHRAVLTQIEALSDAVSGVSLDEEAMMMLRYQRAFEANARFFTVVDEAIQALLSMARS